MVARRADVVRMAPRSASRLPHESCAIQTIARPARFPGVWARTRCFTIGRPNRRRNVEIHRKQMTGPSREVDDRVPHRPRPGSVGFQASAGPNQMAYLGHEELAVVQGRPQCSGVSAVSRPVPACAIARSNSRKARSGVQCRAHSARSRLTASGTNRALGSRRGPRPPAPRRRSCQERWTGERCPPRSWPARRRTARWASPSTAPRRDTGSPPEQSAGVARHGGGPGAGRPTGRRTRTLFSTGMS